MVFRILQYLMNQQHLVDKLSQTNFMRKIAQFIVHKAIRAKSLSEDIKLEKTLKSIAEKLKDKNDKLNGKQ